MTQNVPAGVAARVGVDLCERLGPTRAEVEVEGVIGQPLQAICANCRSRLVRGSQWPLAVWGGPAPRNSLGKTNYFSLATPQVALAISL